MLLSAVSRGAYAVGLGIGKGALPIAAEVITVIALKSFTNASPKSRIVIVTFPGAATFYLASNFPRFDASDMIAFGIYSLFKVLIWKEVSPAEKPQLTKINLRVQYLQLMGELNFMGENSIDLNTPAGLRAVFDFAHEHVRARWKDSEIIKQADALIKNAAIQMDALYDDLKRATAAAPEESQNERMAELLTRRRGPNDYYARFCKEGSVTLLDIYRTLRGLSFSITCTHPAGLTLNFSVIDNYNRKDCTQLTEDVDPFFKQGTSQYEWRVVYNKTVERFAPILKEMILMAETLPFKAWATPDYNEQIAYEKAGAFRLYPCHKPK